MIDVFSRFKIRLIYSVARCFKLNFFVTKINPVLAYVHEKFKDGQNAYQWEDCFRFMNTEHERLVFTIYDFLLHFLLKTVKSLFINYEATNGYGLALKKGVIYNKFDKGRINSSRN